MGVFNIIETFFFLSLAITFVLILLLVNHFKQRINLLEQKCDTMFEIINNILQEMGNMKKSIYYSTMPPMNTQPSIFVMPSSKSVPEVFTSSNDAEDKIIVSDDEDEDDTDEEDDSDDEDDSDEDDRKIKIVNVDIQDKIIIEDIGQESLSNLQEDFGSDELIDEGLEGDLEEMITEISEIPVIKVDKVDDVPELSYDDEVSVNQENQREIYNKMSVQDLKKVVITKGLCSDVSKLKKVDLLKLLEQEA
jgi:hypothetical protein